MPELEDRNMMSQKRPDPLDIENASVDRNMSQGGKRCGSTMSATFCPRRDGVGCVKYKQGRAFMPDSAVLRGSDNLIVS